jgi:hypothetical protein
MRQIPPHADKKTCDSLVFKQQIYGCGKPFQMILDEQTKKFKILKCGYDT